MSCARTVNLIQQIPLTVLMIVFFFNDTATTEIYTLSLHDALPILQRLIAVRLGARDVVLDPLLQRRPGVMDEGLHRSEEHTSELQSRSDLVCRLLLEKKKSTHTRS